VRREEAFRAWTDPELFSQWFGAPGGATDSVEMDVRVGGSYRIKFRHPFWVGWTTFVVGEYLEVVAPERLVYTFAWEPNPLPALGMDDSRVTVEFRDLGETTEVRLTHEQLEKPRLRAFHRGGWQYSLKRLDRLLERSRSKA
jgi:uncharacterized protein YndB with AHSA1/START domain